MAFYQTQIKSISGGVATDVSGKRLTFMANYPCKEGDFVWTDGLYIFGNVSVKSSPVIFDIKSGIPVLADNLRGYFDSGKFKNYKVAQDNWFINDGKRFKHGADDNVLDVDISGTGDIFSISVNDNGVYFSLDDEAIFSDTVNFSLNDEIVDSFNLADFNDATEKIFESFYDIRYNYDVDIFGFNVNNRVIAANVDTNGNAEYIIGNHASACIGFPMDNVSSGTYTRAEFFSETFLWESSETVLESDTDLKNSLVILWEYICGAEIDNIFVSSYKYTEKPQNFSPNVEAEFIFHKKTTFNSSDISVSSTSDILREKIKDPSDLVGVVQMAEYFNGDPKQQQLQFSYSFGVDWSGEKNKIPYTMFPVVNQSVYGTAVVNAFAWVVLFKENHELYADEYLVRTKTKDPDDIKANYLAPTDFLANHHLPYVMSYKAYTPLNDSYLMYYRFFANDQSILPCPYIVKKISTRGEVYYFKFTDKTGADHEQWLIRPLKNTDRQEQFVVSLDSVADAERLTPFVFDSSVSVFKFPMQDNYLAEWQFQPTEDIEYLPDIDQFRLNYNLGTSFITSAIFDSDTKIVDRVSGTSIAPADDYYYFDSMANLSAAKFGNKKFLIGIRDKQLLKVDNGEFSTLDENFKNFRLRKIKNISKTRR